MNIVADIENPQAPQLVEEEKAMIALASIFLQGTTLEFKANGNVIISALGQQIEGTCTYHGNRFTLTVDGETVDSDNMFSSGDYVTLSKGVLTLVSDQLNGEDGDMYREDGFTKYIVRMTFKK